MPTTLVSFLRLGEDIIVSILSDWLDAFDLVRMDVAFTSHIDRSSWLTCLSLTKRNLSLENWKHNYKSLQWLFRRKMQVENIKVSYYKGDHVIRKNHFRGIHMPLLESINFCDDPDEDFFDLNDHCLQHIGKGCPNLKRIHLGDFNNNDHDSTHWSLEGIEYLVDGCKHIKALGIYHCSKEKFPELIAIFQLLSVAYPELNALFLSNVCYDDYFLMNLPDLFQHLTKLELSCVYNSNDSILNNSQLSFLSKSYPGLLSISIDYSNNINPEGILDLIIACPLLQELGCYFESVNDDVLFSISTHCKDMKLLRFPSDTEEIYNHSVTDRGIQVITEQCCNLNSIEIASFSHITDQSAVYIAGCGHQLKTCSISGCNNITKNGYSLLIRSFKIIEYFDLFIFDDAEDTFHQLLPLISTHCPCLKKLCLSIIQNLNDDSIGELAKGCPLLQDIEFICDFQDISLTLKCFTFLKQLSRLKKLYICGVSNMNMDDVLEILQPSFILRKNLTVMGALSSN